MPHAKRQGNSGEMVPTTPGTYRYTDPMPGAKPERLRVEFVNGQLCAMPPDPDSEGGRLVIPVEDMAGEWATARS